MSSNGPGAQAAPWPWAACLLAAALALSAAAPSAGAQSDAPVTDVVRDIDDGRFAAAQARIEGLLQRTDTDASLRARLEFERERMRRIRLDFPMTEAQARQRLRDRIPDLREDEFQAWKASGRLEHLVIDGEPYYFTRSVSNLFLLDPQAAARRAPPVKPPVEGPMERANAYHEAAVREARATGRRSVAPRRVRVTQSLVVEPDAVPAGEMLRAWIPYPRAIPGQQDGLRFLGSQPGAPRIAPESALQRTVLLEQRARAGEPTRFSISYELTVHGQVNTIDPDRVVPLDAATIAREGLAAHLGERAPHIVFTDAMRAFSRQVVGNETRPYHVARKLFDAVDRIPWAGAREYSTLTNISDYALRAGHADCGQQTLLLMTLLRLNGIPARWQSGMVFSDGTYDNLHDWGWMYLAPYGWVPMDVTTGRLDGAADPAVAGFYFGGLDAYRIAFNDDFGQSFVPPKQHFRSETVDSQRGEVEWRGGNLYFDRWDYTFEAHVVPESTPGG
ncbi:transglutaminase-like domain-containing protein [Cognatilysobacter segetis]|uniref:transglutaminase-like domain-containing protein n=1 Tax=Cognatilysobacter segetis TaxID=2492394 RepID=UPI00105FC0AB|nr:transglutaminase-like domain-containing protein [Lysobacter segetis]